MALTTTKIRRELAKMVLSTSHACTVRNDAIKNLTSYEKSKNGDVRLEMLFAVYGQLSWLSDHVRMINDRQVLPSERVFLADALTFIFKTYEKQRSV
ncbi:hypothetical protein AAX05_03480 [Moraxella bovoculi]|uniref:Uncharacterized protein n=1 Tax=Moraxella bovoculi TaxID=386891 RepID=A0AAC8PWR0_9GAMM|nr:hypothetical protein [Moraxella bovoculi]AKG08413.1 hypothetical protein AAX06_09980 [Moraxella bovoculi]AKG09391.1 hypothetical protein AAX05_03480 [Moraxella bovoculi]AKG13216.1 hypothetical protein AAX11_03225 [Moraxella bovoculi]